MYLRKADSMTAQSRPQISTAINRAVANVNAEYTQNLIGLVRLGLFLGNFLNWRMGCAARVAFISLPRITAILLHRKSSLPIDMHSRVEHFSEAHEMEEMGCDVTVSATWHLSFPKYHRKIAENTRKTQFRLNLAYDRISGTIETDLKTDLSLWWGPFGRDSKGLIETEMDFNELGRFSCPLFKEYLQWLSAVLLEPNS